MTTESTQGISQDIEGARPNSLLDAATVSRLGSMVAQVHEELRLLPEVDAPALNRVRITYLRALDEVSAHLPRGLRDEYDQLVRPRHGEPQSSSELRVAQAQLIGWLEGTFAGADFAQTSSRASHRTI